VGENVTIVEVGPRDGLQNEREIVATEDKLKLISLLGKTGLSRIEATAFVSPKWVPQMADHDAVMRGAERRNSLELSALVPNEKGALAAIDAGTQAMAVFASASESFAQKNTNCSIAESIARFEPVAALARAHNLPLRGYISCAVDCPYEGAVASDAVVNVANQLIALGCDEIAVSDTLGKASPAQVEVVLTKVLKSVPANQIACHFHDTSGQALANVDVALALGVRSFDSAVAGLGGCPYAPGATGNLATGTLVRHLKERGFECGVDLEALEEVERFVNRLI
jgi:hydroxymethylglutaryl-CoA lyase